MKCHEPIGAYQVIGDAGLESEQLLFDSRSQNEAVQWAKGYTRRDLGGYASIRVSSFLPSGEAVDHYVVHAQE